MVWKRKRKQEGSNTKGASDITPRSQILPSELVDGYNAEDLRWLDEVFFKRLRFTGTITQRFEVSDVKDRNVPMLMFLDSNNAVITVFRSKQDAIFVELLKIKNAFDCEADNTAARIIAMEPSDMMNAAWKRYQVRMEIQGMKPPIAPDLRP